MRFKDIEIGKIHYVQWYSCRDGICQATVEAKINWRSILVKDRSSGSLKRLWAKDIVCKVPEITEENV